MRLRSRLLRAGATAVVLAGLAAPGAAVAATAAPGPASLTDVQVSGSTGSAMLTMHSGDRPASVDPRSVTATIDRTPVPVSVQPVTGERRVTMLLIDTSGSMGAGGMATVARAAGDFLDSAPRDVEVGVVAFSDAAHLVVAPTLDRGVVRRAVAGLRSHGETTLYDGILLTLAQLAGPGDRSFVLLSDGGDTRSSHTLPQVLHGLGASGVRAEVVGFKTDETQTSVLGALARAAHGSVAAAGDVAAVSSAFRAAARALDSQLRLVVSIPANLSGTRALSVRARVGGTVVLVSAPLSLGAAPPASASPPASATTAPVTTPAAPPRAAATRPARTPGILGLAWPLLAGVGAVFVGLALVALALMAPAFRSERNRRVLAIESYVNGAGPRVTARGHASSASNLSDNLVGLGERVMEGRASTPRTVAMLERADLPLRVGEWAVLRVAALVAGVLVGSLFLHGGALADLAGMVVGGLVGLVGPALFLRLAAARRSRKFESQLPEVLTLVASSLSTGFSLMQGLDAVARDAADPAAKEFARALAETRIGADIDESLERMADRMDSDNLRWTSMAIHIQRQVGGNLSETLRTTAGTLRERESLHRHVRALSAEGRLSAYILIGLPIGIFLYMLKVNRDYIALLWSSMMGIGMLVGGVVSLGIGMVWMRKVATVEV